MDNTRPHTLGPAALHPCGVTDSVGRRNRHSSFRRTRVATSQQLRKKFKKTKRNDASARRYRCAMLASTRRTAHKVRHLHGARAAQSRLRQSDGDGACEHERVSTRNNATPTPHECSLFTVLPLLGRAALNEPDIPSPMKWFIAALDCEPSKSSSPKSVLGRCRGHVSQPPRRACRCTP